MLLPIVLSVAAAAPLYVPEPEQREAIASLIEGLWPTAPLELFVGTIPPDVDGFAWDGHRLTEQRAAHLQTLQPVPDAASALLLLRGWIADRAPEVGWIPASPEPADPPEPADLPEPSELFAPPEADPEAPDTRWASTRWSVAVGLRDHLGHARALDQISLSLGVLSRTHGFDLRAYLPVTSPDVPPDPLPQIGRGERPSALTQASRLPVAEISWGWSLGQGVPHPHGWRVAPRAFWSHQLFLGDPQLSTKPQYLIAIGAGAIAWRNRLGIRGSVTRSFSEIGPPSSILLELVVAR